MRIEFLRLTSKKNLSYNITKNSSIKKEAGREVCFFFLCTYVRWSMHVRALGNEHTCDG